MVHMASESDHHEKLSKDDHEQVLRIKEMMTKNVRNPFSTNIPKDKLINISSGETLVSTNLVEARKLGLEGMRAANISNA